MILDEATNTVHYDRLTDNELHITNTINGQGKEVGMDRWTGLSASISPNGPGPGWNTLETIL